MHNACHMRNAGVEAGDREHILQRLHSTVIIQRGRKQATSYEKMLIM